MKTLALAALAASIALSVPFAGTPADAAGNQRCDARLSRDQCDRYLRSLRSKPIESQTVAPNTRSKYQPVPQAGSEQPGRYIVPR
jgi:hypothetical protein